MVSNKALFAMHMRQAAYLLLSFVAFVLLSTTQAAAQTESVTYGFIRDDSDPAVLIAAAFPNADIQGDTFDLGHGALFIFSLPAGTVLESEPNNVRTSDLVITPLNNTQWTIEAYPAALLSGLGIDAGDRDFYRVALTQRAADLTATVPLPIFSFSLPDGCNDGEVEVLANDSTLTADLFDAAGVRLGNVAPAEVASATTMRDLYAGVDENAGSLECEATTLAVTLNYFLAEAGGTQVDFVWQTATETGNAGFNLLAEEDGVLTLLNSDLIPSKVIDTVWPTDYAFSAATSADVFYLDEVSADGKARRNGPFFLGVAFGALSQPDTAPKRSIYLPSIRR